MLRTTVLRHISPSAATRPYISRLSSLHHPSTCARQLHPTSLRGTSLPRADSSHRSNGERWKGFHTTPPRQVPAPFIAMLASVLKASVSIEYARVASRIALTLVPVFLVKNHAMRKYIRHIADGNPELVDKTNRLKSGMRRNTILYRALIVFPAIFLGLTLIASLERAPLTGRWRLILLSPDEEHDIAKQLAGTGWYNAVGEIISQDGPATIIPPTDWRYQWVQGALRHLESSIPILAAEKDAASPWLERGPGDAPRPPPAEFPLRPRPNAREFLHWFCELSSARVARPTAHSIPGPPYSLLIVDRPDCHNAFSFGFGPDGGGGIVVYSGFLDEILTKGAEKQNRQQQQQQQTESPSWFWSAVLGPFAPTPRAVPSAAPCPTPEQNAKLAILLAHELAHLILSHHLETLSSVTVIMPGALSMAADVVRALLFPVTMLFGPFVNDAVANLGKIGSGEVSKVSEWCTSMKQEFEADEVSTRILAHAGYDARSAVKFWQERSEREAVECTPNRSEGDRTKASGLAFGIMGSTHPGHSLRVERLKKELERWEIERHHALAALAGQQ